MTSYAPNELRYHYSASAARTAIFSEIYYPDGNRASSIAIPSTASSAAGSVSTSLIRWTVVGLTSPMSPVNSLGYLRSG